MMKPLSYGDADEVLIDVDLVRRLLAARFPQWAGLSVTLLEMGAHRSTAEGRRDQA